MGKSNLIFLNSPSLDSTSNSCGYSSSTRKKKTLQRYKGKWVTKVSDLPTNTSTSAWQKKVRQEYDQQVNKKKAEIQNFQKQSLKDSIRIGYVELAEINLKFGFAQEALNMMRKSYHETNAREEQFGLSKRILLTAFETKQDVFMDEFSEIAMAFDNYKSTITTQMIYVLNCLSKNHDLKVMANKFANLQEVSIG